MDISIILQVITVSFSVITMIGGYIFETILNRKTRKVSTITNERILVFNKLRQCYCNILAVTEQNYINEARGQVNISTGNYKKPYIYNARKYSNELKSIYCPFFVQEKHINQISDKLISVAIKYFLTSDENLVPVLNKLRNEFFIETSIYDKADWNFIVVQADGKDYSSLSFDNLYKDVFAKVTDYNNDSADAIPSEFKKSMNKIYKEFYEEKEDAKEESKK